MSVPRTLDTPQMIGLNTLISCHGKHQALNAYVDNCERIGLPEEPWAKRYIELYVRYSSEREDGFIDGIASRKALSQMQKEFK